MPSNVLDLTPMYFILWRYLVYARNKKPVNIGDLKQSITGEASCLESNLEPTKKCICCAVTSRWKEILRFHVKLNFMSKYIELCYKMKIYVVL